MPDEGSRGASLLANLALSANGFTLLGIALCAWRAMVEGQDTSTALRFPAPRTPPFPSLFVRLESPRIIARQSANVSATEGLYA